MVSQSHLQDRSDSLDHFCILLSVKRAPWKEMQLSDKCALCLQWLPGITLFPTDAPKQVMLESDMSASSAMHNHSNVPCFPLCGAGKGLFCVEDYKETLHEQQELAYCPFLDQSALQQYRQRTFRSFMDSGMRIAG